MRLPESLGKVIHKVVVIENRMMSVCRCIDLVFILSENSEKVQGSSMFRKHWAAGGRVNVQKNNWLIF